MFNLKINTVPKWIKQSTSNGDFWVPRSINSICPFCNEKVNFTFSTSSYDSLLGFLNGSSTCPNCNSRVAFIVVKPKGSTSSKIDFENLYIYPEIKGKRIPITFDTKIERLKRSYISAVESYNAKLWNSTVTMCRQVLEGIAKTNILKDEDKNRPLFKLLEILPQNIDLNRPILNLAAIIREGGNLGAHFDLEKEADEQIASEILDMLEYLIEYIYQLPDKISKLKEKISKENKK